MIDGINNDLDDCVKKTEDINTLLLLWKENNSLLKKAEERKESIKVKIKKYLKERNWSCYKDTKSKISVSVSVQKRENIDRTQLKYMLTESQLAQVINTVSFEKMIVITPEARKRLKNYVKKK